MCDWRGFLDPEIAFYGLPQKCNLDLKPANVYGGLEGVFWEVRDPSTEGGIRVPTTVGLDHDKSLRRMRPRSVCPSPILAVTL